MGLTYHRWNDASTTWQFNHMFGKIPYIMNARGVTFVANGTTHHITSDNPNYAEVCKLISDAASGRDVDIDYLVSLRSPKALILSVGGDRLKVEDGKLFLDGAELPNAWYRALLANPGLARILLINVGDTVLVAGDEDAPDGEYIVQGVDNDDPEQRIYLETEDGFLGYIKSTSIKESRDASP